MLWRKQSGYFFLLFWSEVPWLLHLFSPLLLSMLSQRRAANTLALVILNFFAFVFVSPFFFPEELGKSYYTSVKSLSELVERETGIQTCVTTCRNNLIALDRSKKAGRSCGCVVCAVNPSFIRSKACCAVMTVYITIFESRNVNTSN